MKRPITLIAQSADKRVSIYVDDFNAEAILCYIEGSPKHIRRFEYIKGIILGRKTNDAYKRETIDNENIRDVHAMRFDLHAGNGRIYCKQIDKADRVRIIIAGELHRSKKSESNGPAELALIRKVHNYDYDV